MTAGQCAQKLTPRGRLTGSYVADHVCELPTGHTRRHHCHCTVEWDTSSTPQRKTHTA